MTATTKNKTKHSPEFAAALAEANRRNSLQADAVAESVATGKRLATARAGLAMLETNVGAADPAELILARTTLEVAEAAHHTARNKVQHTERRTVNTDLRLATAVADALGSIYGQHVDVEVALTIGELHHDDPVLVVRAPSGAFEAEDGTLRGVIELEFRRTRLFDQLDHGGIFAVLAARGWEVWTEGPARRWGGTPNKNGIVVDHLTFKVANARLFDGDASAKPVTGELIDSLTYSITNVVLSGYSARSGEQRRTGDHAQYVSRSVEYKTLPTTNRGTQQVEVTVGLDISVPSTVASRSLSEVVAPLIGAQADGLGRVIECDLTPNGSFSTGNAFRTGYRLICRAIVEGQLA